jgi:hypothetical protein
MYDELSDAEEISCMVCERKKTSAADEELALFMQRFNYGLQIWKDGLDGSANFAYQMIIGHPYDDWDEPVLKVTPLLREAGAGTDQPKKIYVGSIEQINASSSIEISSQPKWDVTEEKGQSEKIAVLSIKRTGKRFKRPN